MKRLTIVLTMSVFLVAYSAAQTEAVPGFYVKDARSLGMGGTFLSVSEGFQGLYGNPASFASRDGELTILDSAAWIYAPLGAAGLSLFQSAVRDGDDAAMLDLLSQNGAGGGYRFGIGYAGKGLGLGLFLSQDSYAPRQDTDLAGLGSVQISSDIRVNAVIGLALPVKVFGLEATVGGNLRPFFHAVGTMSLVDARDALASGDYGAFFAQGATGGYGLAVDLGAQAELGAFTIGLTLRDLAPAFAVSSDSVSGLLGSLGADGGGERFTLSPNITAGVQYHPDLGGLSRFLDPLVIFEIQDPVSVIRDGEGVLNLIHAGAEIRVFSCLYLRAGVNKGWLSVGAGLDLLFLKVNAAVFTEDVDGVGRGGLALEASIRL